MPRDTDPRLLRSFLAVAEELHFTRAAARLHVAQQALSRDVRRLERELGAVLFTRTTRRVGLTADGARLLPYARRVLAAHEALGAAFHRSAQAPLTVDVAAPVSTGQRVLEEARRRAPGVEFVARYHSGLTGAARALLDGGLDVSFGRFAGLDPALRGGLEHRLVRLERVAVLLPAGHRLAGLAEIPLAELAGETLYAGDGNDSTAEWTDYARALFRHPAVPAPGIALAPPFPRIEGDAEFGRVVRGRGWSVLASEVFVGVPGMVLRPLTAPVPVSPVSMVRRRGARHPGLDALDAAADALAAAGGWRRRPAGAWLPPEDVALLPPEGAGPLPARGAAPPVPEDAAPPEPGR